MNPQVLRHLIIALLLFAGIFHLAIALLNAAPGLGLPMTALGVAFTVLSFYVRRDVHKTSKKKKAKPTGRNAIIITLAATLLGLGLSLNYFIKEGEPAAMPLLMLIEAGVAVAAILWLVKIHRKT